MLIGKFYCDICDQNFEYKSRYTRHLESKRHNELENLMHCGVVESGHESRVNTEVLVSGIVDANCIGIDSEGVGHSQIGLLSY